MPAPLNSFRAVALAAATGAALALGTAGASAETVACGSLTFTDGTVDVASLVSPTLGCAVAAPGVSQDFQHDPLTVNLQGFFGQTDWAYAGSATGTTSGKSGSFGILAGLWDSYDRIMAVFKGPNAFSLVAYDLKPGETSFTFLTPFIDAQPGNGRNAGNARQRDVSHISIYASGPITPTAPIPLPAAAWLMLTGLGGLAVTQIRRRRKTA